MPSIPTCAGASFSGSNADSRLSPGAQPTDYRIYLRPSRSYPAGCLFHPLRRRSTRYCQWHLDVAKAATNALAPPTQSELEVTACNRNAFKRSLVLDAILKGELERALHELSRIGPEASEQLLTRLRSGEVIGHSDKDCGTLNKKGFVPF